MKKGVLEQVILYDYRYFFGYIAVIAGAGLAMFWRISKLLPGLSPYEAEYLSDITSLSSIITNPLYWPYKLLTLAAVNWLPASEAALRLPSILLASIGLLVFFLFVSSRFKPRIAIISVALLAMSSWWLHYARLARPEILIPVLILLLIFIAQKTHETHKPQWLFALVVVTAISLYIPLMPYVIAVGLLASKSLISKYRADTKSVWFSAAMGLMIAMVLPLLATLALQPWLARELFGLPEAWPGFVTIAANIANGVAELFWEAPGAFWPLRLGTLPFLDLFTVVMFALGLYHLDQDISRTLAQFVLAGLGLLLVVTRLSGEPWTNVVLIPFIYILVSAGIVMLFSQWYEIFPKNPIARMTAFIPTIILLLGVIWYHQQRYFVAWPNSPEIIKAFPPLSRDLRNELESSNSDQIFVVVSDEETEVAKVIARPHYNAQITTVGAAAEGQSKLIISSAAYEKLDSGAKKRLGDLREVHTQYSTSPISLYVSQP